MSCKEIFAAVAILVVTMFGVTACVMPGDIRAIGDTLADNQKEVLEVLADESMTAEEKADEIQTIQDLTRDQLQEVIDLVEARTKAILAAPAGSPITGNPLLDLLLAGLLGGGLGAPVGAKTASALKSRKNT